MVRLNCGRVPVTAQSVGLGDRFRYWRGVSGRRYLFSLLRDSDFDDLQNVVVIEAAVKGMEPVPVWLGEIDGDGEKTGFSVGRADSVRCRTFVHFPDGNDGERRHVMLDLTGQRA